MTLLASVWIGVALGREVELACPPVGTVARYAVTSDRLRSRGGEPPSTLGQFVATHRLEVLSVDGAVLRVSDRTQSSGVLAPPADPLQAKIVSAMAAMDVPPIVLVIDTANGTVAVEDVAPLTIAYAKMVGGLASQVDAGVVERLRGSLLDPDAIRLAATAWAQPLARFGCGTFTLGAVDSATWVPNVFGGPQVASDEHLTIESKGAATTFRAVTTPRAPGLQAIAAAAAGKMSLTLAEGEDAVARTGLSVQHELTVTATRGQPWPQGWQGTKHTTTTGGPAQLETVRVERQAVD